MSVEVIESKPWWMSKTIWVNAIAVAASIAAGFGFVITPEVQASLSAGILAVANIALRIMTKAPITAGSGE